MLALNIIGIVCLSFVALVVLLAGAVEEDFRPLAWGVFMLLLVAVATISIDIARI